MNALLVKDEALRSQAPEQDDLSSFVADPVLQDLVELTGLVCDTPLAFICIAGTKDLCLKAAVGTNLTHLVPGSLPFESVLEGDALYEIANANLEPEYSPHGFSIEEQDYSFYAAVPLASSPGVPLGILAVLDLLPRQLTQAQSKSLSMLARQVSARLDLTAQETVDPISRESEARYRQLVENSLGMVFTHDAKGILLSLNKHGATTVGRTVGEMIGLSLAEFIPAKRQSTMRDYLEEIAQTGEAQGLLHLTHSNGEVRVIAYRNKLILAPDRVPYVLGFGIDITEQVHTERKLRVLTRQSNSILESVGDGIFCIDLDGKVTVVNVAAAQMLGYRQDEMLGKLMHSLIHHTKTDGTIYPIEESPIRKSLSNFGTARVVDEIFWRKDGSCFPVEYIARPLIDGHLHESGAIRATGVVVAFTDTTERRALDRMKDEFISTVSHELRTPLTSLRGALGLLSGGTLETRPEKSEQMLEIAINNTDRLIRLVNDILDLERISSGKNELHLTHVRADDLLYRAVNAQQSSQRILFAATEVKVWADPDRILQVLHNLLSNAIKFSEPEEEIHLTVRSLDDQEALFEVKDYGRGIPEDKIENIFDRFHQGDASDSRESGGTGLGLAICRRIVNQHGGHIWATSKAGKGTTVHFTLPTRPRMNLR